MSTDQNMVKLDHSGVCVTVARRAGGAEAGVQLSNPRLLGRHKAPNIILHPSGIFWYSKLMTSIPVICSFCKKSFDKEIRRLNEARKFGWNLYCSKQCLNLTKIKKQEYFCQNPQCLKRFSRCPKEISLTGSHYCSSSCAATVNNKIYPKTHLKIRTCSTCQKNFTGHRMYCCKNCVPYREKISSEKIITLIKKFYSKNARIPFRKEFPYPKSARKHFGTWNKAITAAGFIPNPVRFANKFIAKDGHKCDSLAEKIIDDWLNSMKISHQVHVRYDQSKFTSDFLVGNTYIEFFGLKGQLRKYDNLAKQKLAFVKDNHLKLLSIYPEDLFPTSKLNAILGKLWY